MHISCSFVFMFVCFTGWCKFKLGQLGQLDSPTWVWLKQPPDWIDVSTTATQSNSLLSCKGTLK